MTQPDKWYEMAFGLFAGKSGMVDEPGMITTAATALRSAYQEGERAGMERAAKIAKVQWLYSQRELIGDADREMELCEEIETAIRAAEDATLVAEETKE